MLIISHSELDSYISCNIQRVRIYTGTLYYSYRGFKSEIGNTPGFSSNEKKWGGSRTGKQQLASEVSVQCFAP